MPDIDDDALLTTEQLFQAFDALNLPLTKATLESARSRGNGPPYEKYGRFVRYRWGDARNWRLNQGIKLTQTIKRAV